MDEFRMQPVLTSPDGKRETVERLAPAIETFLAQDPRPYRGYLVKPMGHRGNPFYFAEPTPHFCLTGYVIVHPPGHEYAGCNAAPGATWFRSLGEAKTFIDVLYEVGLPPGPNPLPGADPLNYEQQLARSAARRGWSATFWEAYRSRL